MIRTDDLDVTVNHTKNSMYVPSINTRYISQGDVDTQNLGEVYSDINRYFKIRGNTTI